MTNISIDISNKLDQLTIELYRAVDHAARAVECEYLVVGASARDLLLHHGYGMNIERATNDVDLGVQVRNWLQFNALCDELYGLGFQKTARIHRLQSPQGLPLDVVPFGGISDSDDQIAWPPDQEIIMNVLGFQDALQNAVVVRIAIEPELTIPIASTAGLALLKVIAWTDRPSDLRRKDAQDLYQLARSYWRISAEEVYEDVELLERFELNADRVGAYLLGRHCRQIAVAETRIYLDRFLHGEIRQTDFETLIHESLNDRFSPRESNEDVLRAFSLGVTET